MSDHGEPPVQGATWVEDYDRAGVHVSGYWRGPNGEHLEPVEVTSAPDAPSKTLKKKGARTYTIIKTHRGRVSKQTGTVQELTEYFHYTLECGNSWNHSISLNPRGGKSLVNALNKCVRELQGGSFSQDHYELES